MIKTRTIHITITFIFLYFFSSVGISQENVIRVDYKIKLAEDDFFFDAQLITDGRSSIFRYKNNEKSPWNLEGGDAFSEGGSFSQKVYTDSLGYIVYNQNLSQSNIKVRGFCNVDQVFVYEDLVSFDWVIKKQEKEIGGMICRKAVCKFRGRTYEAFYNPDIASFSGPWKFSGLPGLIVEIRDKKEEVTITLKSIEALGSAPEIFYNFSTVESNMSRLETRECLDKEWLRRVEKMRADAQRIQAQFPNVEIEFEASEERTVTELDF